MISEERVLRWGQLAASGGEEGKGMASGTGSKNKNNERRGGGKGKEGRELAPSYVGDGRLCCDLRCFFLSKMTVY